MNFYSPHQQIGAMTNQQIAQARIDLRISVGPEIRGPKSC